ncbi:MAG: AAA family ATPase [Steroidobacteraceae bacterium]
MKARGEELLERDTELARLADWLAQVHAGSGRNVLITGEAGLGKTSLIREFIHRAGVPAHIGACDALFTPHPLAPWRDIARQRGGSMLAELALGAARDTLLNAILGDLERDGTVRILVVEDLHWADEASLDVFKFLARRIERTRCLLIGSYREDAVDARHPLNFVLGDLPSSTTHRVRLAPLSVAAVAALAEGAGRSADTLHSITGGNPFYVTEVLAAPEGEIPASIRAAVLARLAPLTATARRVAELCSVIPGRAEPWLLRQLDIDDETSVTECQQLGMLRLPDGSLSFRHELARQAIESSLGMQRRRSLHALALRALRSSRLQNVAHARLVHHAERAGDDAAVVELAPLAAEHAAHLASHREAAAHYRSALRSAHSLASVERAQLQDKLAYECYLIGAIDEAIEARMAALVIWRAADNRLREGDELRWLSRLQWFLGNSAKVEQFGLEAVTMLEALDEKGPELAMAYSNLSQYHMLCNENAAAISWGERAVHLAEAIGADEIRIHALNNIGSAKFDGVSDAGDKELHQSLREAVAGSLHEHAARAYTNIATNAVSVRNYPAAWKMLDEGLRYCEERDLDSWYFYMLAWRARARFETGDWESAEQDASTVLARKDYISINRIPALIVRARILARRGSPDAAVLLGEALALAGTTREPQRICPAAIASAELAWLDDNLRLVAAEARRGLGAAIRTRNPWPRSELSYWLWRAGAWRGEGDVLADPYARQIAGEHLAAYGLWTGFGCPYEAAMALYDAGDEASLRAALTTFTEMEAQPMVHRVRHRLRAIGAKRVPRGSRASTRANAARLTRRELQVLALVAEDLTNAAIARRLYLTTKTVTHHVTSILGKLDAHSRREAVQQARNMGIALPKTGSPVGKK